MAFVNMVQSFIGYHNLINSFFFVAIVVKFVMFQNQLGDVFGGPAGCPNSTWQNFGQSCYFFSSGSVLFDEARNICHSMDSCMDPAVNGYWIGMYRLQCLLADVKHIYWLDNSDFKFSNWDSGDPNDDACCVKLADSQNWRDKGCASFQNFICERPISMELPFERKATKRLTNKYIVSDSLEVVWNNRRCSSLYCLSICLQQSVCAAFNMRPGLQGGCICELKDARSWLTFDTVSEVGASYWGYPIHGYNWSR
ncbi:hypothetical protein HELRODRAFT_181383 [Helobdella robusta]|uniref:C-type lectin domain-containing protein n=1 Tax=Helobdella robusta TaxID=6412 RepID=T1FGY2_HELRO|nr:hypothetical protein HELRODRAFT_181383 [Helobdella robusta]ESN92508.1 hypothetical protein HELRODRAFT_181383 [Helobdella robusta]